MLEIGKMPVNGEADETLLMDAATLVEEAMGPGMAEE
jgi:ATP-dependent Lhr-like helicase